MKQINITRALSAGHFVECFDATIYGFYAVLLAPMFFPSNSLDPLFFSFLAFSAGFVARPLGALVLATYGDKKGRTKPVVIAMGLVGVPTLIIGFLPTYSEIGLSATFILFACRIMQGFCFGAETAGVNVYMYETYRKTNKLGRRTGLLIATGGMGAVVASALGAIATMECMPSWAWRIPFIVGGLAAFVVYFWRRLISETEEFEGAQKRGELLKLPLLEVWRKHRGAALVALILFGFDSTPLYLATTFGNKLFKETGYSASEGLLFNLVTLILMSLAIALFGRIADKNGFNRQIKVGALWLMISALPAFYAITYYPCFLSFIGFIFCLILGTGLVCSSIMPYINQSFPANCRFSGVAISITLGAALIAGNTPLVALTLVKWTGTNMAPALWLMAVATASFLGVSWREKQVRTHLDVDINKKPLAA
jgi:MHS family proline/betaine transporter-like MFS transporter